MRRQHHHWWSRHRGRGHFVPYWGRILLTRILQELSSKLLGQLGLLPDAAEGSNDNPRGGAGRGTRGRSLALRLLPLQRARPLRTTVALTFQWNRHLLGGRDVAMHGCRPLAAFPPLQLRLHGGVRVGVSGIVGEGLRALFPWVIIEELDDEGLLGEVLRGTLLRQVCGG